MEAFLSHWCAAGQAVCSFRVPQLTSACHKSHVFREEDCKAAAGRAVLMLAVLMPLFVLLSSLQRESYSQQQTSIHSSPVAAATRDTEPLGALGSALLLHEGPLCVAMILVLDDFIEGH